MWRAFVNTLNAVLVIHAAVLLAVAAWLVVTGRIDGARLRTIAQLIEILPPDDGGGLLVMPAAADRESQGDAEPEPRDSLSSADRLKQWSAAELDAAAQSRRLERQAGALRADLFNAQALLAKERAAFEAERAEWEAGRRDAMKRQADADFQRVVDLLASMPARQAKEQILRIMAAQGPAEAARHLAAMQAYQAADILRWFRPEEQDLAAQLLENMQSGADASAGAASRAD